MINFKEVFRKVAVESGGFTQEGLLKQEKKKSPLTTPEEEALETLEKKESKSLGGGCNITHFVEFKDDGAGVFKPKNGESKELRDCVKAGTYFKRERSAYLIDRFLGFNLVPSTVIREIDGEKGSVQQFIQDAKTGLEVSYERLDEVEPWLQKLFIFDYIIYNSDRHSGNFLIKDDRIYAIDNGLAFGNDYLRTYKSFFNVPLSEEIREQIKKFLSWEEGGENTQGVASRTFTLRRG